DPGYPRERLGFMLSDACAPVLVTQAHLRARLPAHGGHVVCLDADADAIARHPASPPRSGLAPQHPAYVIYTSGSTGTPKGVLVSPRGLVNHMSWMMADHPVDERDVVLCRTAISFDAAGWEVWLPLFSGAAVCITPSQLAHDPTQFSAYLKRQAITIAQFVPSLLAAIPAVGTPDGGNLRHLFLGGESLASGLARDVIAAWKVAVVNL